MAKVLRVEIEGVTPLLMHDAKLADPLDEVAQELSRLTTLAKRAKTDAAHMAVAECEWRGGLYVNDDEQPIIPGTNVEAMLIVAGKRQRKGGDFKAGISVDDALVKYDGPKSIDGLWADKNFRLRKPVRVGNARVIRTRPRFPKWSLSLVVSYQESIINQRTIIEALETSGNLIGLGDWRPKYGRFVVKKVA